MGIEAISARIISSSASRVKNAPLLFRMSDVNTKAIGDSGEQVEISVEDFGCGGGAGGVVRVFWSLRCLSVNTNF